MRSKVILIVDDSADNRVLYGSLLEFFGYEVVEACNGDEGVRRARERHPDLIVMDVAMPVMNGLEATRLLKGDPRTSGIPLVIVSAHDTPSIRHEAERAGCDSYLTKPAPPMRILEELERLLPGSYGGPLTSLS